MINKKDRFSMPEILEMINESLTKMQQHISNLDQKVDNLRQEMNQNFNYHETWLNKIDKNMATKGQLNSLLNVLQSKKVISSYEVHAVNLEV